MTVTSTEKRTNSNLHQAKRAANDEFYSRIEDVEAELYHYRTQFQDKTVYLNCDDPRWSAFWRYFALKFQELGLKRLIATHYTGVVDPGAPSFMLEILRDRDEDPATGKIGVDSGVQTALVGDGDFRSEECVELLRQSDIVVTNPPFSLFREYVAQLVEHEKQFVILGNPNGVTYKEIWPLVQANRLWWGVKSSGGTNMYLRATDERTAEVVATKPEGSWWRYIEGVPHIGVKTVWFTNMDHARRHEELSLWKRYSAEDFPTYDNYDAINVNKVKEIPRDYDGVMGVPITFLDKWNPEQFELVGFRYGEDGKDLRVNGKTPYFRILVKRVA